MSSILQIYNSLSRQKEDFTAREEGYVGMYVCGPTVYSDVHLGNVRTFSSFDVIYRFLIYTGYKVRYVRNITDVGHLLDDGEDRISKGARLEKLEPMEVVQKYTNGFHDIMRIFNNLRPSIEPRATQHILEQIEMVQQILDNGYAYEINGSVYFDTIKYAKDTDQYGKLSGRVIDDLMEETRELKSQGEKNHPSDFAIWMKAQPEHIMRWNSPWGEGFPGWHLECSVMSTKYLGKEFDIHGGGNDLKFPHHENEIAQNMGACKCAPAKYWLHTNMLIMNGRKMSKSDGNTISPEELFTGESPHVSRGYSPMEIRFFMLQAHYRSTVDITDGALLASSKGYKKLMGSAKTLDGLTGGDTSGQSDKRILTLMKNVVADMNDDFNTPKAIATLFELVSIINGIKGGQISNDEVSKETISELKSFYRRFIEEVLGLKDETSTSGGGDVVDGLMSLILDIRQEARENKNWTTSDLIRDALTKQKIVVKDGADGSSWSID